MPIIKPDKKAIQSSLQCFLIACHASEAKITILSACPLSLAAIANLKKFSSWPFHFSKHSRIGSGLGLQNAHSLQQQHLELFAVALSLVLSSISFLQRICFRLISLPRLGLAGPNSLQLQFLYAPLVANIVREEVAL